MKFTKSMVILLLMAFFAADCKKNKTDDSGLLFAFIALYNMTKPAPVPTAPVPVAATTNTLVQQVSLTAGTLFSYTFSPATSGIAVNSSLKSPKLAIGTSTGITVTIKIIEKDSGDVKKSITFNTADTPDMTMEYTPTTSGKYIVELTSNENFTLASEPVITGGTAETQVSTYTAMQTAVGSTTSQIVINAMILPSNWGFSLIQVGKKDTATGTVTYSSTATVTLTIKGQTVTATYKNPIGLYVPFAGYDLGPIPWNGVTPVAGDTAVLTIVDTALGVNLSKTITIPDAISNITLKGTAAKTSGTVTLDTNSNAVITWTNPAAFAPNSVVLSIGGDGSTGPKSSDNPKGGVLYTFLDSAPGTFTVTPSMMVPNFNTLSATDSTDDCMGLAAGFSGNKYGLPDYLQDVPPYTSQIFITNVNGDFYNGLFCESNVTYQTSLWNTTTYGNLIVQ